MTQILMPALSPTMTEGKLSRWLKQEGEQVKAGDVIAEIETDKATMEVEAVDEGQLTRILVPEGTEGVAVNTPIAELNGGAGAAQGAGAVVPQAAQPGQHGTAPVDRTRRSANAARRCPPRRITARWRSTAATGKRASPPRPLPRRRSRRTGARRSPSRCARRCATRWQPRCGATRTSS
jgi:pyruvate/2-oxoglutarate dehydrogenase complex dihydrolipoamide acyltransferase (E2) component